MSELDRAVEALRAGEFVILLDHPDRENEADVLLAAEHATGERVNWLATHVRGLITVAAPQAILDALDIPLLPVRYPVANAPRFAEPVDAVEGTTTGASAFDRAVTLRKLADPQARPEDFSRPGHIFPLMGMPGGLAERRGHTEGSIALAELAGIIPVVAICELMAPDGHMAAGDQVADFAREHGIPIAHIEDIIERL
ncbi:MAG: 3,4-dihydroxy-2-butanone-4-phosphate synthase [Armatimonadetes bacterium]|nr:3,4-dihydroxy-2-butanone-4-phosphate synthase [Armatimonadota bacterium]